MTKLNFILSLNERLSGLPREDLEERLSFYSEMIDDRMEEGLSEAEAVAAAGSVDEIAEQILSEISFAKLAKERIKPKRSLHAWEILLLVLGSPIWLALGIAAFAVILSVYAVIWALIATLWAVFGALAGGGVGFIAGGVLFSVLGKWIAGLAVIGGGLVCAGLSVFSFFGALSATKGAVKLTGKIAIGIKKCFVGKEKK